MSVALSFLSSSSSSSKSSHCSRHRSTDALLWSPLDAIAVALVAALVVMAKEGAVLTVEATAVVPAVEPKRVELRVETLAEAATTEEDAEATASSDAREATGGSVGEERDPEIRAVIRVADLVTIDATAGKGKGAAVIPAAGVADDGNKGDDFGMGTLTPPLVVDTVVAAAVALAAVAAPLATLTLLLLVPMPLLQPTADALREVDVRMVVVAAPMVLISIFLVAANCREDGAERRCRNKKIDTCYCGCQTKM